MDIRGTSHRRLLDRQTHFLFNNFLRLRTKEHLSPISKALAGGESISDRWIPLTKGQQRRKQLHVFTQPWTNGVPTSRPLLTHWGRVTHIWVGNVTIIGSDNGLSPGRRQIHYLNQCWYSVNWTLRNKLQWNFNWNSNIFIRENALQNVVCKMASILPRPQCVKKVCIIASTPHACYVIGSYHNAFTVKSAWRWLMAGRFWRQLICNHHDDQAGRLIWRIPQSYDIHLSYHVILLAIYAVEKLLLHL